MSELKTFLSFGILICELFKKCILYFRGMKREQMVLLTHGDSIDRIANDFNAIARSSNFIAGIECENIPLYGVQFHPEVDLTLNGRNVLHNFLFNIAGLTGNYTLRNREAQCIQYIRDTVGNKKVLVRGMDNSIIEISSVILLAFSKLCIVFNYPARKLFRRKYDCL